MCGIIGYNGPKKAREFVVEGLRRLEYRGYDSAGCAAFDNDGKVTVEKKTGKVENLAKVISKRESHCAMGHTRWATHGGVTDKNAHPHRVGQVTLIHNGILENFRELTRDYGFTETLVSETDSEVAAALLNHFYNGNPGETIRRVLPMLEGTYAFLIMFDDQPGQIYAIRKVSPLVAGMDGESAYVASDLTAFLSCTKNYFVVPENVLLKLENGKIFCEDENGNEVKPEILVADWDPAAAEKNGYEHFMLKEIHEQPEAFLRTVLPRIDEGMPDFDCDAIPDSLFEGVTDVTIVACGTALYAGLMGRTLLRERLGIRAEACIASEFRYETPLLTESSLVIVVSQSGETIDTLKALQLARTKTKRTLSLVNVKGSSIATESDYVLYTHAGPEIAVASTKAYTVQVAAFYLVALRMGYVKGILTKEMTENLVKDLLSMPEKMKAVLGMEDLLKEKTELFKEASDAFYLGRGQDAALANEGALKLKEISYIHAEAYAAGELKHGTIALISDGTPVVALATQKDLALKVLSNVQEVKARGAKTLLITREGIDLNAEALKEAVILPETHDAFTVFPAAVACQIMAYYTAVARHLNPDQPRNLAKSVTVE